MSDKIVRYCSPTLAGLKTGNIFSESCTSESEIREKIAVLNSKLGCKGLRFALLRFCENRALIYVYRPCYLERDLSDPEAAALLAEAGYRGGTCEELIGELIERLANGREFPHEIGLFIGYPPEDIRGFIENKAMNFKCAGCWKVYGDVDAARRCFAKYDKCTAVYCRCWNEGKTIEQLAVCK